MNDVMEALRERLPGPVLREAADSEPFEFLPSRMYLWPIAHRRPNAGASPQIREEWEVMLVIPSDITDEEPQLRRRQAVTDLLGGYRDAILDWIEDHRSTPPWDNIDAMSEDDYLKALEVRGVGLRISGYRFLA